MISVISPIYNSSKIIEKFVKSIVINLQKINHSFEIILIDDSSTDDSWKKLLRIKLIHKNIKIFKNKKNLGQHPTVKKALKKTKGDLIFILDCDFQDDPKYFKNFINLKTDQKTAIFGKLDEKTETSKGFLSNIYWFIFSMLTRIHYSPSITTFTLIDRFHIKYVLKMSHNGFLFAELKKKDFPIKFFYYNRRKRLHGKSSYNNLKLISIAFKWIKNYI